MDIFLIKEILLIMDIFLIKEILFKKEYILDI
jgi:hypothetical protein